jgi:hypothetical protein
MPEIEDGPKCDANLILEQNTITNAHGFTSMSFAVFIWTKILSKIAEYLD